jgi:acetyl esterase/lipase
VTPSLRLRLAAWLLRLVAKPSLRHTRTPERAARDFARSTRLLPHPPFVRHLERPLNGVPAHWIAVGDPAPGRAILWLHGGAFFSGSGRTHAGFLGRLATLSGVEVVAPDYRLLQEAPFPAALDDALAAWDGLAALGLRPSGVALGGDSAGGGLALSLLSLLLARGERPAALALVSPWTDLTLSGESLRSHGPRDALIPVERMAEVVALYLGGADPRDPRASPAFADYPGAPPALIQVGDREALLSDAEAVAARLRAGGGEVTLDLWPHAPHVWHAFDGLVPESRAALARMAAFLQTSFESANR